MDNMQQLHEQLEKTQHLAKQCTEGTTDPQGKMLTKVTEEVVEALEEQFDKYLGEPEEK